MRSIEATTAVLPHETAATSGAPAASPAVEPRSVFQRWDYASFAALSLVYLATLGMLARRWFVPLNWQREPLIFVFLTLLLAAFFGSHLMRWILLPLMRKPRPLPIEHAWRVGVATTFVPGVEPLDVLEETVMALVAIDYPHDTWVLDEGDDAEAKALCERCGANHFSRKTLRDLQTSRGMFASRTKHGNLNVWLSEIANERYDVIAAFDSDHVPDANYLAEVLGYFEDPRVGYVQVAQAYRNQRQSWIARGAAEETYDYFSTIQMASYGLGYPIMVGGHNVHRMRALWDVGGFGAHDADDLLTTLLYRDAGWQGVYVPQILARGLCPAGWDSYLTQQRRWARSVLDLKLRTYPGLTHAMPLPTRAMSYLHGFNYLLKGLLPALALGVMCAACFTGRMPAALSGRIAAPLLASMVVVVLCDLFRMRYYLDPRNEWSFPWRAAVLRWAKWPQMLLALGDVVLNRRPAYTVTDKSAAPSQTSRWQWPHLAACAGLLVCWLVGSRGGEIHSSLLDVATGLFVVATATLSLSGWIKPRALRQAASAQQPRP